VAGCLLTLAACGGDVRDSPTALGGGPGDPPDQGGDGGTTGNRDLMVGRWLNTLIIQLTGDYQRIETTWVFDRHGQCSRTVETFSVLEDRLFHTLRDCSYHLTSTEISVLYDDAQDRVEYDFRFVDFSRDRVELNGFEFRRLF
jgi:hypothetical protein